MTEILEYTLDTSTVVYPQVDETLTVRGKAADAKVVGDKFSALVSTDSNGDIVIKI